MQDKTILTANAYDQCADAYADRFMDLSLYKPTFDKYCGRIRSGETLLDLGCGPGNVSRYISSLFPSIIITGIDISHEMIKLAKSNAPGAKFIEQDIRHIDFPDNSFDHIIAAFCLPFLYDKEAHELIKKCSLILKNKSFMYLSAILGSGYRFEKTSFSKDNVIFFNYYSREFLESAFASNGLTIVDCSTQLYPRDTLNKTPAQV